MQGVLRVFNGRRALGWMAWLAGALGLATLLPFGIGTATAAPADGPSYIVVDADSGDVLAAHAEEAPRFPASLTKMMTLYMTFEALRDRRIALDQLVPVSPHAASMEPTKLGLVPGIRITVRECILGMLTRSANDAASSMGELLGGTEPGFARMMTLRAHALGMTDTYFRNASGLPDARQVTTARDMALLARRLIQDFPQDYAYFSAPSFVFQGHVIYGHDPLLASYPGADGMKTGFTNAAGYNLASSALRVGRRLIGIVLGAPSSARRNLLMVSLLDASFRQEGIGVAPRAAPPLIAAARAAEMMQPTVQPAIAQLGIIAAPPAARHFHARAHATVRHGLARPGARTKRPVRAIASRHPAELHHTRNGSRRSTSSR